MPVSRLPAPHLLLQCVWVMLADRPRDPDKWCSSCPACRVSCFSHSSIIQILCQNSYKESDSCCSISFPFLQRLVFSQSSLPENPGDWSQCYLRDNCALRHDNLQIRSVFSSLAPTPFNTNLNVKNCSKYQPGMFSFCSHLKSSNKLWFLLPFLLFVGLRTIFHGPFPWM